jgi:hypothetical protein
MTIKKNCSNTVHPNWTRWSRRTTLPSCDGSDALTLAAPEFSRRLVVPASEGSLKSLG